MVSGGREVERAVGRSFEVRDKTRRSVRARGRTFERSVIGEWVRKEGNKSQEGTVRVFVVVCRDVSILCC